MNILNLLGRSELLFNSDITENNEYLNLEVSKSKFLVIGAAGTIGQAVVKEIFKRDPKVLHVVDISENNLVELVRDLRSTIGYGKGDFKTFAVDCGSLEFQVMLQEQDNYDYVFNLSALKHVRSEKDPYTLMRMTIVNIFNSLDILELTKNMGIKNYFCVSTDKAANPVNMMGASKRIMEMFLMHKSLSQNISMARFANVAFSDGSLLHGFNQRMQKRQPLSAPNDVKRYFVTSQESGELCLLSGLLGNNRDIFFPKLSQELHLITFSQIAKNFLKEHNFEPYECESENEARQRADDLISNRKWPCYFFKSDTTGEKDFEEFFTENEDINMNRFKNVGVIKNKLDFNKDKLDNFIEQIKLMRSKKSWNKNDIVNLYMDLLPDFTHKETGKYLDQKM